DAVARDKLLAVARKADPDPWRDRLREAYQRRDGKTLEALAANEVFLEQPPASVLLLVRSLPLPRRVEILRRLRQPYPGGFQLTVKRANSRMKQEPPDRASEAVGFWRAALALRPEIPSLHVAVGSTLRREGQGEEAASALRQAIRLDPGNAQAHYQLG